MQTFQRLGPVVSFAFLSGCQPPLSSANFSRGDGASSAAPIVRAHYGASIPLVGAPAKLSHEIGAGVGVTQAGRGWLFGGELGVRARVAGEVTGGTFPELSFLTAYVPRGRAPFLLNAVGVGLATVTSRYVPAYHKVNTALGFLSPHETIAVGVPIAGGLVVSAGLSLQFIWQAWDDGHVGTQLLLTPFVDVGFYDPQKGL